MSGDPTRLRQILINLLGNAIKFTKQGWVSIACRYEGDGALRFVVEDSGIGIPATAMANLFSPFQQADSSTTHQFGGTGLGLSIARRLARLMGGDVTVASEVGRGTKFEAVVRLAVVQSAPPTAPTLGRRLILAVASDRLAAAVASWCVRWGFAVDRAHDAASLALLLGARGDGEAEPTVLTDGACGAEALLAARGQPSASAPIVLCGTGEKLSQGWLALGAHRLAKPVRHSALARALRGETEPQPSGGAATTIAAECLTDGPNRVLVVEDNAVNRRVAEAMLRNLGAAPTCVDSGEAALGILAERTFDLVLLDMAMPGMDGSSTARAIRAPGTRVLDPKIPIVALTANVLPEHRATCFAAGMNDFLAKPLRRADLATALVTFLRKPAAAAVHS